MERVADSRGERTQGIWSMAEGVGKGYQVPREVKRGKSQTGGEHEGRVWAPALLIRTGNSGIREEILSI